MMSQSLHQSDAGRRRTTSLVLPRSVSPASSAVSGVVDGPRLVDGADRTDRRTQSSRLSLHPWRTGPKPQANSEGANSDGIHLRLPADNQESSYPAGEKKKKGIWNWKPIRALSHIAMRRLGCLLSIEVIKVYGLPDSMNGLRLSVAVRKKETKDGTVQTTPSRVLQGSADVEETLFIRCNLYCTGGGDTGKPLKFETRQFLVSVTATDAPQVDFGKGVVDLSSMVLESVQKSLEGQRLRNWDMTVKLYGKAKGGELALKLGFQIMDDGIGIYSGLQSKSSFSVPSSNIIRSDSSLAASKVADSMRILEEIDELDLPEFEVIEKGVENAKQPEEATEVGLVSSEVVKEVVHYRAHHARLMELASIAKQIKELESMMNGEEINQSKTPGKLHQLDAEEETVTKEFLQMLEMEGNQQLKQEPVTPSSRVDEDFEQKVFLSDLGKGLGPVVQTKDGGFLISVNPFDAEVARSETPKLAMQISRPSALQNPKISSGFEVFHRLAAMGREELGSTLLPLADVDELMGKTAEKIAFEGIASAIISGRNKEGASSSANKSIQIVKKMAETMVEGRKERNSTGIWSVKEEPMTIEEILIFSLQKMEAMAVDGLKIQAELADEEPPFDLPPLIEKDSPKWQFDSLASPEDWIKSCSGNTTVTMLVAIQLRDPSRRYEAVGSPMIAVLQAIRVEDTGGEEDNSKFKVANLSVGGMKLRSGEKQRLTAKQWLVAYGLGKAGKRTKALDVKGRKDSVWSLSSRVMADMWLKSMRNPDVKVHNSSSSSNSDCT
ncbi:protein PLASTID MOVEMENT IMPAIRED 1-like [Typha latifolia]|uniref:protein PLASTID MOVEMENT IMPAIRED 1-like n=1 Tax=Typha latifolia TaxID=4733 RepID=UPI003C2E0191